MQNKHLLDKVCSYAEKANIVRYELLNIFGGVYLDSDIEALRSLIPFHQKFDFYVGVEPLRRLRFSNGVNGQGKVIFCTAINTFVINFSDIYLGCVASSRTQLAGENWTRGSDLPDGKFCRETFDNIIRAIVGYEMVDLTPVVESIIDLTTGVKK